MIIPKKFRIVLERKIMMFLKIFQILNKSLIKRIGVKVLGWFVNQLISEYVLENKCKKITKNIQ